MPNRLKLTIVLLPFVSILLIGTYVYSLWAEGQQRSAEVPVEAASMMMRDLLAFHKKRGSFPKDLKQLEGVVWESKPDRGFSNENRALSHRNFMYLYTRLNSHAFTLWAIPSGPSRDEGSTWFLSVTPDQCRSWKGAALPIDSVKEIVTAPSTGELAVLGLTEQPKIDLARK